MDKEPKPSASRDIINKYVHTAVMEYDGVCASVAMFVLGKIFSIAIDQTVLLTGVGVRFPGVSGSVQSGLAGVAQFIAYAANLHGMDRQEILCLCRAGQIRCQEYVAAASFDIQQENDYMTEILLCAVNFIEENRQSLGLDQVMIKPKQYYDGIYADREAMFKHSPYALEERLSAAVGKGNIEEALEALRLITAQGEKAVLAKNPLRSSKNSIIGSIAFLARAAIHVGISANEAFALSDALTQQVEEMTDREAVLAFEEKVLLQFVSIVRQKLEGVYSVPIVKAMHYVENHLNTKIPLNAAAAYASVHPAYLSACFKRETGLAFTHYVAMRKVQESSYFVRYTDYSITQIAVLYGFSSQSYYITVFKKVMGMTPMDYRRRYMAD